MIRLTATRPVAVITGAASGLGLDLARSLSSSHQLILLDVNESGLQSAVQELEDAHYVQCDLTDNAGLTRTIALIKSMTPRVDLLINNAGITHRSLARITTSEVIERVMQINYFAPVRLTQGLLSLLTHSAGKVVNISSMAGWMPVLGRAGYCASKSALHQYFETFRAEMRDLNVSVLMVYPSFLDTPIENNALAGDGGKTRHKRSVVGTVRSSQWMATNIVNAINSNKQRLFGDFFSAFSALLYRLSPRVFLHLMRKRLASELEVEA
ncbi:SDR family NAD(P)-dependent oxidoreductase [Pseudoalteromonas pernae]|uniref:SDR family NAD(P)-dependent oxidoreductase n=1 Tax=Pseudoalteromonas pernae TaxID=3118054 RepID=UPI003242D9CA